MTRKHNRGEGFGAPASVRKGRNALFQDKKYTELSRDGVSESPGGEYVRSLGTIDAAGDVCFERDTRWNNRGC